MTLWAFVSDIHGNASALRQVEAWCSQRGVERYVCLGDVIGRGDPSWCVRWVRDHAWAAIVGNRDLDYLDRVDPPLRDVMLRWPNEVRASDFVASHGDSKLHKVLGSHAIRDDFRRAAAFMKENEARIWFFGHTHNARAWRLSDEPGVPPQRLMERSIELEQGSWYVVNVGTTGMPLPGRGAAAFATYDDVARRIEIVPLAELRG